MMLLCKSAAEECKDDLTTSTHSSKLDYVHRSLLKVINLFVDALISFYSIEDQIKGEKDLRRELLFNLITNFVLEGELYFIVYNLASGAIESDLHKLRNIMSSKELLENCVSMSELKIEPQFQFDLTFRNKYERISQE